MGRLRVSVSKFLIRKGRWMGWVKAAADRLETLVLLVAEQPVLGPEAEPGGREIDAPERERLPGPGGSGR